MCGEVRYAKNLGPSGMRFPPGSLACKGFSPKWLRWIKECISTVSYTVRLNGKGAKSIRPMRGLRQGDQIFHYLFILVANVLSRRIEKVVAEKQLIEIWIKRECLILLHLIFVDDSIFFLKGSVSNLTTLRSIIDDYCRA